MPGEILNQTRTRSPLVHCMVNLVTANDCANMVLATGASPIMAEDLEEVSQVAASCDALALNLGTPGPRKIQALLLAGETVRGLKKPVVFDPVGAGCSDLRKDAAQAILTRVRPDIIRGNADEIRTLQSEKKGVGRMKAFSNPLVFDEKEMRRSNVLNEMLHGQYEDVFRWCIETRQLRPVSVDFSRVWLCLTGMKRSSYTQLGRMPYEQLELNQRYAEAILPQLDAMGLDTELFMNVYSREKLLVFLLTPRDEAADVAQAAQTINDVLQAMYERELPGGGIPYFNFTVLSRRLNSFDEVAPAFERLSRLHALSFFEMRSVSRTQEELERRAQRLDERALAEHIQTIKTALLSGDEQSRKGAQVLLYERLRDGADPETVRAVMRELRQMLGRIIRVFSLPDDPAIEQALDMARYSSIRALCDACFELLDVYDRRIRRRDLPMGQITFKALEYIANHYQENLSQKDVADYIGITPQYLSGLFNREIGRSIPDVINEKRVERAKELLHTTALSGAEIARRVGFGNTTYFYTVFRKLEGVTVREYREQAGALPE